jgi:CRP-like cAMP-binding protein
VTVDGRSVAVLGPGCGFGELALLLPGGRRTAVVSAVTAVRLLVFTRPEFATLMQELLPFARRVRVESHRRLSAAAT